MFKEKKIKNFFYASSSEIYNLPKVIPTPEDVPATIPDLKNPRFSYGGSKIIGELLCQNYLNKQMTFLNPVNWTIEKKVLT